MRLQECSAMLHKLVNGNWKDVEVEQEEEETVSGDEEASIPAAQVTSS